MDIFTIYNEYDSYKSISFKRYNKQSSSSKRRYNQLIQMLSSYVETSLKTERVVHVYRDRNNNAGYTLINDNFKDLTAENMSNYLTSEDGFVNRDDFLLNSLLDIVPEKIELHCSINSNLYTTLTKVFPNVTIQYDS